MICFIVQIIGEREKYLVRSECEAESNLSTVLLILHHIVTSFWYTSFLKHGLKRNAEKIIKIKIVR